MNGRDSIRRRFFRPIQNNLNKFEESLGLIFETLGCALKLGPPHRFLKLKEIFWIFRVCQKHVVFPKLDSNLTILDKWRYFGWFARNMWFFQNLNPNLTILTEWRYSGWFARNMWFFQNWNPNLEILAEWRYSGCFTRNMWFFPKLRSELFNDNAQCSKVRPLKMTQKWIKWRSFGQKSLFLGSKWPFWPL